MMDSVGELNPGTGDYVQFSGAGLRDFTRISASSAEMWKDICLMNRHNLVQMIDRYLFSLNRFKREISSRDEKRLEKHLKESSDARKRLG